MRFVGAVWRLNRRRWAFSSSSSPASSNMDNKVIKNCKLIKEGEVEILMHLNNTVFYNKVQVNNRDMSIAVLRTYISKLKQENAKKLSKKVKAHLKVLQPEPLGLNTDAHSSLPDDVDFKAVRKTSDGQAEQSELIKPKVLEALAASGLRSLRYAKEVDGIDQVIALDINEASVEACKRNIQLNGSLTSSKVEVYCADARVYMLTHPKAFDVVDIDPYGSPSVYLDSAVQSVSDGGILMCTATDMAVMCGNDGDVCYSKYGSYPLRGKYCHEMALRILLACIENHANRYKRHIVPILSVYMDFYIRVFVRIFTSASEMKNTPLKLSYVYQCVGCDSFHLQSMGTTFLKHDSVKHAPGFGPVVNKGCGACGKKFRMGGPIWSDPIHDQEWVASILENVKAMKERYPAYEKISAVLMSILEELPEVPLFVNLHNLCATLKCTSPSATMFRSAVMNAGYRISGSHVTPLALKSDAPMDVIWDIMRCWVKKHPVKPQTEDKSGTAILSKEPTLEANFGSPVTTLNKMQAKVRRFPLNPERNWGQKIRAGRKITAKHVSLNPGATNTSDDHP